jgi:hypothetical protein
MPDRQRHGRLSDVFARLFAARSRKSQGTAPVFDEPSTYEPATYEPATDELSTHELSTPEPLSRVPRSGDRTPAAGPGGPLRPDDPEAGPAELSRPAWELAVLQSRASDRPDLMDDTMLLSPLTLPRPTAEPADPDSGPDTGLDAGSDVDAEAAAIEADADVRSADADNDIADDPDADPIRSRSARSVLVQQRQRLAVSALRQRRRLAVSVAGVAAVGALLALPPVRAELRDSFTRTPQAYTALYFTSRPQVDGTVLTVPVSVHAVDTGTDAYSVRVWTVDAKGRVGDSHIADLTWDGQAMSTVVSMPVNPAAEYVWVSLNGSDETLHYKIAVA